MATTIPGIPLGEQLYFGKRMFLSTMDGPIEMQLKTEKDLPLGYVGLDEQGNVDPEVLPDEVDSGLL